ncbi:MAG: alpha/beta fold hydrolase [Actinomycetota bacterium]|nr:alpha/beta fold hydrolase [Actinomycetota bacterium]
MDRQDVRFPSRGSQCAAWLWRPDGGRDRVPLVVMAHGFSATRELRLDAYAERFCAAGMGVLLFDYRHFGASQGEPRQLLDIDRQLADYHAALAHARSLDWVDADRVAVFGSSFSGGHVIVVAAEDQRVAAVVSQCPFTDGLASLRKLPPVSAARASALGLADQVQALRGGPPRYIPAVGPPGSVAMMTAADAQPGFAAMAPPQTRWENRVAARIVLRVPLYRPGRQAAKVSCPALFCVCEKDSVAPAPATLKLVQDAPKGEIRRYPVGHFDIYLGAAWEQAVSDQTDFLVRSLRP